MAKKSVVVEIPAEVMAAGEKCKSRKFVHPFTPGELKGLWLQWPIVNKREYSRAMTRAAQTYSRIYRMMCKDLEVRAELHNEETLSDAYFIGLSMGLNKGIITS